MFLKHTQTYEMNNDKSLVFDVIPWI